MLISFSIISVVAVFALLFWMNVYYSAIARLQKKIPSSEGFGTSMVYYHPFKALKLAKRYDVADANILKKALLGGLVSGFFFSISMFIVLDTIVARGQ